MTGKPETTDDYLAGLPDDQRETLENLRTTIRAAAPEAQESISSGFPSFKHRGKYLVSFGAARRHVALYVMRGSALEVLEDELEAYDTSSTVVRFVPDEPLPAPLVKRIVETRLGEIGGSRDLARQDQPQGEVAPELSTASPSKHKRVVVLGGSAHGVDLLVPKWNSRCWKEHGCGPEERHEMPRKGVAPCEHVRVCRYLQDKLSRGIRAGP